MSNEGFRVAGFIVVPCDDFDEITADNTGKGEVGNGSKWCADNVGGNNGLVGDGEGCFPSRVFGRFTEDVVDFGNSGITRGYEGDVDDRAGDDGDTHGDTIELASKLSVYLFDSNCCTSGLWDNILCGSTTRAEVFFCGAINKRLRRGVC